jgi:hypothetical protein
MIIRPLIHDDLRTWWPDTDVPRTVRGFAAELEGRVMGVAGLMYMPTIIFAFAEMVAEGQAFPLSIMRMVRKMRALMLTVNAPIVALADPKFPHSEAFLEHVGFERAVGRQFVFKKEGGRHVGS